MRRDVRTLVSWMGGLESNMENLESSIKAEVAVLKADAKSLHSAQSQTESKVADIIGEVDGFL